MSRKILVTGGCGFVGTNLVMRLSARGDVVTVYDNLSRKGVERNHKMLTEKFPEVKFMQADVAEAGPFLSENKFDLAYHLAAQVAVTTSYDDPASDFRTNALGSFNIASSGIPTIYASTNKVFGENVNAVSLVEKKTRYDFAGKLAGFGISEDFPLDSKKHTPYGVSKLVGDLYMREFGGVVNRFSCMYGPWQHGNTDQGWLAHFIKSKLENRPVTIYGDGKQIRDVLYIDDVIDLLELEGDKIESFRGEVFNIGGGYDKTISLLELCEMLDMKTSFADWRPADQKVYYSDIRKAAKLLGWKPKWTVEGGVEETKRWLSANLN
ncbi:MAG: hypothetical protein A2749_02440 [Parcubacteria group bacterium RIFCSPHIGHO2_01_FULL_45_26]|nr:MAG: hypothetical protein A2749_02440 [Parcubacteria group bacterium RIFCSPHIGHO2_01_FULL_45_26]